MNQSFPLGTWIVGMLKSLVLDVWRQPAAVRYTVIAMTVCGICTYLVLAFAPGRLVFSCGLWILCNASMLLIYIPCYDRDPEELSWKRRLDRALYSVAAGQAPGFAGFVMIVVHVIHPR